MLYAGVLVFQWKANNTYHTSSALLQHDCSSQALEYVAHAWHEKSIPATAEVATGNGCGLVTATQMAQLPPPPHHGGHPEQTRQRNTWHSSQHYKTLQQSAM